MSQCVEITGLGGGGGGGEIGFNTYTICLSQCLTILRAGPNSGVV